MLFRSFGLTTEYGFRAEFEAVLLEAESNVRDPKLNAFLRAQRATLLSFAGRLDEAVALATSAQGGDDADEISALRAVPALGAAWMSGGKPDAACSLAERMFEPAVRRQQDVPQAPAWVLSIQLPSLVAAGRLDDAERATEFLDAATAARGASADGPSYIAFARGMIALHRGFARTAERWLREAAAGMRTIARTRMPFAMAHLTEACALLGDADGATAAIAEADDLVGSAAIFEGPVRRARAWAALARGQRSAAIEAFLHAAEWAHAHGQHTAELFALHDAVRLGGAGEAAAPLITLAADVDGRWPMLFAAHARAVVADEGTALDAVATEFEKVGALLLSAEAAAEASAAFRRSGLTSLAARAAARASALAALCDGARTPLLHELDQPLPLTRREREVANLAASGLPSQAIAERLFVSVRTVEGHLQRVYDKLGVDGRRSLARVLDARAPIAPDAARL